MNDDSSKLTAWAAYFDGHDLDSKLRSGAILATTDADDWPHLAYLSAGEVLAHNSSSLSLALWPASRTTANIGRNGGAVLHVACSGQVYELRLAAVRRPSRSRLAIFDVRILETVPHHAPYATVCGLIDYDLHDPAETLQRWKLQIAELRAGFG